MTKCKKAPLQDFAGNDIHDGDIIQHPSGEMGVVCYLDYCDEWRVAYDFSSSTSSLCLQVGEKGRAVVSNDYTFSIAHQAALLSHAKCGLVLPGQAIARNSTEREREQTYTFADGSKLYVSSINGPSYFWLDPADVNH